MTYSKDLGRHIEVSVGQLNKFNEAELDAALAALPGYPDTSPEQIREAAARGDINARYVVRAAEAGDPVAKEWV